MQELQHLKKHQLEDLQHQIRLEIKRRYHHSKAPKYGTLDKSFKPEELEAFLQHVTHPKARTIFSIMAGLGLRIGEACSLRTKDIDIPGRRLWVSRTEKGSVPTMFFVHDALLAALQEHLAAGRAGQEYLFPPVKASNKFPHISPHWVRKEFRAARARAGLNFVYDYSEESIPGRRPRPLYRIVSHSCRHSFGHRIFEATRDILLTQKLMRHANIRNTQRYMYKRQDELDAALLAAFSPLRNYIKTPADRGPP